MRNGARHEPADGGWEAMIGCVALEESRQMKKSVFPAIASLLFGCVAAPVDPVGDWGGDHIALSVGAVELTVEFDCAYGRIPGPFVVGDDGAFALDGVFVVEHGGPVREGETLPETAVRYTGAVAGRRMRLVVEGVGPIDAYVLEKGRAPALMKCL